MPAHPLTVSLFLAPTLPTIELIAIARAIRSTGRGLLEIVPAGVGEENEQRADERHGDDLPGRRSDRLLDHLLDAAAQTPSPNEWRKQLRDVRRSCQDGSTSRTASISTPRVYSVQRARRESLPVSSELRAAQEFAVRRESHLQCVILISDANCSLEQDPNTTGMSLLSPETRSCGSARIRWAIH